MPHPPGISDQAFDHLLSAAGLSLPLAERNELKALYERYLPRLAALHAWDPGEEEPAGLAPAPEPRP